MNNTKYQILLRVHQSTKLNPAHRFDIENNPGHVMENRQCIDELIRTGYLSEAIGSDTLSITIPGIIALEDEQEARRYRKRENIRYCITTAIAIVALLISIIALVV